MNSGAALVVVTFDSRFRGGGKKRVGHNGYDYEIHTRPWVETRVLPVPLSRKSEDLAGYVFKMRMSI